MTSKHFSRHTKFFISSLFEILEMLLLTTIFMTLLKRTDAFKAGLKLTLSYSIIYVAQS